MPSLEFFTRTYYNYSIIEFNSVEDLEITVCLEQVLRTRLFKFKMLNQPPIYNRCIPNTYMHSVYSNSGQPEHKINKRVLHFCVIRA